MSLRGKNVAVPLRTPCLSDAWIRFTAQTRTASAVRARMKPALPSPQGSSHLSYLARAVINQAYIDATPEINRGGYIPPSRAASKLMRQCEALLWLTSDDPDLVWWSELALYDRPTLKQKLYPRLIGMLREHPEVAGKFKIPREIQTELDRA